MTMVQKRLVNAYAVLLLGKRLTLTDVPNTTVTLEDGQSSTLRQEAEIRKAEIEIEKLTA